MCLTPTDFASKFTDFVWLSDYILNQEEELTLSSLTASWWTQDWSSDICLCTKNAINEFLNWLIQSRHPSLRQTFWLVCHEEVKLSLNPTVVIRCQVDQIACDGFSTVIAELVITTIRVWSCWWSKIWHKRKQIRHRDYHILWSGSL